MRSSIHSGGLIGGFGRLFWILGACNVGKLPVGGTNVPVDSWTGGWVNVPARFIGVDLPGLLTGSDYTFFELCDGGASAVKEIIFSPLKITSPNVLLICFCCPVFLFLVTLN